MTPLAHLIAKDATLPVKERQFGDACRRLRLLDNLHFFDVTAIEEAAMGLARQAWDRWASKKDLGVGRLAFLPAPRVWLEVNDPRGRAALMLEQDDDNFARVTFVIGYLQDHELMWNEVGRIPLVGCDDTPGIYRYRADLQEHRLGFEQRIPTIYSMLAMINTPRIIGRRQHLPHAGLQRDIARSKGLVGKYPLHAWHELVLEVAPPVHEDGQLHEAHLTGEKALHFVRCHLRIRLGMLELVSAHWRGNGALGIKQTRYRVIDRRSAA
jgi:hypothetical protein